MKGKLKCYGLLLALFTIFGLFCAGSCNVNALRHDYVGIPVLSAEIPCPVLNDSTGQYYLDFEYSGCSFDHGSHLYLEFEGDSYDSSYNDLSLNFSSSYLFAGVENSKYSYNDVYSLFRYYTNNNVPTVNGYYYSSGSYIPDEIQNIPISELYRTRHVFGENGKLSFDNGSVPLGVLQCNPFGGNNSTSQNNGAVCGGLWNTREYVSSQILPYYYSYDGFYLKSKAIDTNTGYHYSNVFSFNDLFNNYIPTFSKLRLPLHTLDNYFYNPDNLYRGRSIEFKGVFEFDGNFSYHENINSNGSYFRIMYDGFTKDSSSPVNGYVNCTLNLLTLEFNDFQQLEYSCPVTLTDDFIEISFWLEISGNGNYFWTTDDEWRFSETYVVTDHDDTKGYNFNADLTGGGTIPGDANNNINSSVDYNSSLAGLFNFNILNPFASLFALFSDNNSCVQIPTLAEMLHTETTAYCPWFPERVRNILTPVLGISATMILFGFVVKWLKGGSNSIIDNNGTGIGV